MKFSQTTVSYICVDIHQPPEEIISSKDGSLFTYRVTVQAPKIQPRKKIADRIPWNVRPVDMDENAH